MDFPEISKRNTDDFINLMDIYIRGVERVLGMLITAAARTMTQTERQVFHHVHFH